MTLPVLDLQAPNGWPAHLAAELDRLLPVFADWEGREERVEWWDYEAAVAALDAALLRCAMVGFHCTRLVPAEIDELREGRLVLPGPDVLARRVRARLAEGAFSADVAARLLAENEAACRYRAGRIWFCFFPPREDAGGVARLFASWGGEALYVRHERDPETGRALRSVGAPCVVEALVPVAALERISLVPHVYKRWLAHRGVPGGSVERHEDALVRLEPPTRVPAVHVSPDPAFTALAGDLGDGGGA